MTERSWRERAEAAEAEAEQLWVVVEEALRALDFLELPAFREDHKGVLSLADHARSILRRKFSA